MKPHWAVCHLGGAAARRSRFVPCERARDRAQHRGILLYIQYVYIHVCIYTYIYIYIEREREREIGRVRAPGAGPLSPKP